MKTFYEIFCEELGKDIDNRFDTLITDTQMELIELDTDFFNQIPEKNMPGVASTLALLLNSYNAAADSEAITYYYPKEKELEKHINTAKRFIAMLNDETLAIPLIDIDDISPQAEKVLSALQNKRNMMFTKKTKPSKTHIRKFINEVCDEYNIEKSRTVKKFIKTLDKE